jgi:hypothetical protein
MYRLNSTFVQPRLSSVYLVFRADLRFVWMWQLDRDDGASQERKLSIILSQCGPVVGQIGTPPTAFHRHDTS